MGAWVYTVSMASSTSRNVQGLSFFIKPTKQAWLSMQIAFLLFSAALALLWAGLDTPVQMVTALLVGGLSIGTADLFGASAKRLGTPAHVLCVSGFYCGAWLVVFVLDWLFFDSQFMAWMGW